MQRQRLICSLDVYEADVVLGVPDTLGGIQRRLVSLADVAGVLVAGRQAEEQQTRWYGVAAGVVAVGLSADGGQRWLVVREPGPAEIRVEVAGKRETLAVNLPALLGELDGRRDEKGQAWLGVSRVLAFGATAGGLKAATKLHACPLPNCYADGRVCMGNVEQKLFRNLAPAAFFERAFLGSVFTDHAIAAPLAGEGDKRKYANVIQALRALGKDKRGPRRMPLAMLKEVGTYAAIYA